MFNSAYNRKIAGDIDDINRKFVVHEKYVGRGRHGGAEGSAGMTFSTGAIGRSAASGKMGLGAGMSGGNFLETALGFAPLLLGLGYSSEGEDEGEEMGCRCACSKAAGGRSRCTCGMRGCGVDPKALALLSAKHQRSKQVEGVKPMVKRKPRAASAQQAEMKGKGESNYEVEDFEGGAMSGGDWLDTLSSAVKLAPLFGLGKGKKKAAKAAGEKDGRKALVAASRKKKTSPWIAHVKAFAAKHQMKYNEALSDPRTSATYHKK
jgi:hypothetical protein